MSLKILLCFVSFFVFCFSNLSFYYSGDKIIILYDPGKFPALLEHQGQLYRRNGGVPQEGNLQEHIDLFAEHINKMIPDVNFSGKFNGAIN